MEAIAAYDRLLAIKPDLPDSWYNLGLLQKQARAFDEALSSYERALAFGVSEPEEVHLNRAVILSDHLHRPHDAEKELRAALEKNPHYVPALLNLGNLLEDLGRREAAEAAYEQALAADPEDSLALARLAGVSAAEELKRDLVERLRRKLSESRTTAVERGDLGFALAALLDAGGQYDEAFEAARAANLASRAASGARYDRAAVERFVDRSIATFNGRTAADGSTAAPVFICGMFRSGSTLIEQILGSHSRVRAAGELDALPALVGNVPGYPETVATADAQTIGRWRDEYLRALPATPAPSQLVTDKRPDNFLHVGFIKTLFPNARIIQTRRNPLDNLLSLYFLHLDPSMAYASDLRDSAHWYLQYMRLMAHWKALYPEHIFEVDYDELTREPRPVLKALLDFLELDWEEGLTDFHKSATPVKTASVWQVRQPLHSRSSGRWQNYRRHLLPLQDTLDFSE